jgi:hypothetical protein
MAKRIDIKIKSAWNDRRDATDEWTPDSWRDHMREQLRTAVDNTYAGLTEVDTGVADQLAYLAHWIMLLTPQLDKDKDFRAILEASGGAQESSKHGLQD